MRKELKTLEELENEFCEPASPKPEREESEVIIQELQILENLLEG